ncbi:MAG: ABC transporter ATP-binding protein [Longimicrobiales bacterium]
MAGINLQNVSKRYPDGTIAVDAFSLDIADGEFVVLVGPSGCGKSTLLSMVAGLEDITDGTISIDGDVINDLAPRDRNIAMVFQSYALYPHMTVRGNMAFPLELAGMESDAIRQRVEETAAMLDLTSHLDRRPAQLSGGQRQRVAMGRAIVRRPRAFLMDEPLSNLDALLRVQMRRQIAAVQRELRTTTLYVTHDQTEAMTLGDRVVVMRRGVIQQAGKPRDLYDVPANLFVAGFIGSPSMNFVPGIIERDLLRSPLGEVRLRDVLGDPVAGRDAAHAADERDAILGIRPEHFRTAAGAGADEASGSSIRVDVTAVEALGSDTYAYFVLHQDPARSGPFDRILDSVDRENIGLGEAAPGAGGPLVARLPATSDVRQGGTFELQYDVADIHVFDAVTGARLG